LYRTTYLTKHLSNLILVHPFNAPLFQLSELCEY